MIKNKKTYVTYTCDFCGEEESETFDLLAGSVPSLAPKDWQVLDIGSLGFRIYCTTCWLTYQTISEEAKNAIRTYQVHKAR